MKNTDMLFELAAQILNDPALAAKLDQITPGQLRHRLLALAELHLLKDLTDGNLEKARIRELIQIIKPLALLEIREKDLAERRAMTGRFKQARLDEKKAERAERTAKARSKTKPAETDGEGAKDAETNEDAPRNRATTQNSSLRRPTPQTPLPDRPCPEDRTSPDIGSIL